MPQLQQCHETELLARAVNTFEFMATHFWWIQVSQESHWMAFCLWVQGLEHTPQGYLVAAGPGLTSRSPDKIRRAVSQELLDLLKSRKSSWLFLKQLGLVPVSRKLTLDREWGGWQWPAWMTTSLWL